MGVFIAVRPKSRGGQLRKLGQRIDPNIAGRNWDFLTRRNRDSEVRRAVVQHGEYAALAWTCSVVIYVPVDHTAPARAD